MEEGRKEEEKLKKKGGFIEKRRKGNLVWWKVPKYCNILHRFSWGVSLLSC